MSTAAAAPISAPLIRNALMISRRTLTPTWAAARGLAPSTCSRRPNDVRVQHVVGDERGAERDEHADVNARPRNRRQHPVERDHPGLRDVDSRILERALDEDVRDADADERHHQRGDDLVGLVERLQQCRDQRPRRARPDRDEEQDQLPAATACAQVRREPRDEDRAEQVLAVITEVPDVRAEDDDQPDRDQQQRCAEHRAVLPRALLDAVLPDALVEGDRVMPEDHQQQRAGQQRQDHRRERADQRVADPRDPARPWLRLLRARVGRLDLDDVGRMGGSEIGSVMRRPRMPSVTSPIISLPTCSPAPGPLSTMPTIRPREMTAIRSETSSSSSRSVEISNAAPCLAQAPDDLTHGSGRLQVQAVGRLVEDDHLGVEREFAREQQFLDVAARERAGAGVDARASGCRTARRARLASRSIAVRRMLSPAPEGRLTDSLEHEVDRDRHVGDDPLAEAVVGHVTEPELLAPARR